MTTKYIYDGIKNVHKSYKRVAYSRQQMRDTVEGSNAIKRKGEMYLPMPSGFELTSTVSTVSMAKKDFNDIRKNAFAVDFELPWWHQNPNYRQYLQRARFPDITGKTLEALAGIATSSAPTFKLGDFSYLEEKATQEGLGIVDMYYFLVNEVISQGKATIVVDIDEVTSNFYFAIFLAESNTDWDYDVNANGAKYLTKSVFAEIVDDDTMNYLEYCFNENGNAVYNRYDEDCKLILKEEEVDSVIKTDNDLKDGEKNDNAGRDTYVDYDNELKRMGKTIQQLPVFHIGSKINNADADHIPLIGVSDIAIAIYQKDADLTHAEHLTCSPTLFLFGFDGENKPTVLGSGVAVTNTNPQAKAEYTKTDTSGLTHTKDRIEQLFEEAAAYGASLIGGKNNSNEKFGTVKLRSSHALSTMVSVCNNVGKAIQDALHFMAEQASKNVKSYEFTPNLDFIEHSMEPAEITALMSAWIANGISHDTLLHNFQKTGKLPEGVTIEDEKEKINSEIENSLTNAVKDDIALNGDPSATSQEDADEKKKAKAKPKQKTE